MMMEGNLHAMYGVLAKQVDNWKKMHREVHFNTDYKMIKDTEGKTGVDAARKMLISYA